MERATSGKYVEISMLTVGGLCVTDAVQRGIWVPTPVPTSKKTQRVSITKINWLMPFSENNRC
jgi:hypothetical protein